MPSIKIYSKEQTDNLLDAKANTSSLATVATSGSYNDLSNKPTIPTVPTVVQSTGSSTSDVMSQNAVTDAISNKILAQQITVTTSLGTVNCTGVTTTNNVIISPDPSSFDVYTTAGVYCSAQGNGILTFTSSKTPIANMTVNVLIIN